MKEEDGKQTLLIKDLKLGDAGEYSCHIGDRETTAKLQVDEGWHRDSLFSLFLQRNAIIESFASIMMV